MNRGRNSHSLFMKCECSSLFMNREQLSSCLLSRSMRRREPKLFVRLGVNPFTSKLNPKPNSELIHPRHFSHRIVFACQLLGHFRLTHSSTFYKMWRRFALNHSRAGFRKVTRANLPTYARNWFRHEIRIKSFCGSSLFSISPRCRYWHSGFHGEQFLKSVKHQSTLTP